jgi:hypothetical protein
MIPIPHFFLEGVDDEIRGVACPDQPFLANPGPNSSDFEGQELTQTAHE